MSLLYLDTSFSGKLKVLTALTISLLAPSKVLEPVLEDLRPGFSSFLVDNKQSLMVLFVCLLGNLFSISVVA